MSEQKRAEFKNIVVANHVITDVVVIIRQQDFVQSCGFEGENTFVYSMEKDPTDNLIFTFRKVEFKK